LDFFKSGSLHLHIRTGLGDAEAAKKIPPQSPFSGGVPEAPLPGDSGRLISQPDRRNDRPGRKASPSPRKMKFSSLQVGVFAFVSDKWNTGRMGASLMRAKIDKDLGFHQMCVYWPVCSCIQIECREYRNEAVATRAKHVALKSCTGHRRTISSPTQAWLHSMPGRRLDLACTVVRYICSTAASCTPS
jgi:hypothetical protein